VVAEGLSAGAAFVLLGVGGSGVHVRRRERIPSLGGVDADTVVGQLFPGDVAGGELLGAFASSRTPSSSSEVPTYARTVAVAEDGFCELVMLDASAIAAVVALRQEKDVGSLVALAVRHSATGLSTLSPATIAELKTVAHRREARCGEVLTTQGGAAEALLVLCRGEVRVERGQPLRGHRTDLAAHAIGPSASVGPSAAVPATAKETVQRFTVIGAEVLVGLRGAPPPRPHGRPLPPPAAAASSASLSPSEVPMRSSATATCIGACLLLEVSRRTLDDMTDNARRELARLAPPLRPTDIAGGHPRPSNHLDRLDRLEPSNEAFASDPDPIHCVR
jgi:CRP-like cAMP-binding protein